MTPQAAASSKDTTSDAQARFTVSLPSSMRAPLERRAKAISAAVREQTGVGIDVTPAQVVQSLIKQADEAEKSAAEGTS